VHSPIPMGQGTLLFEISALALKQEENAASLESLAAHRSMRFLWITLSGSHLACDPFGASTVGYKTQKC
jgi:hypothetical protein